MGESKWMVVVQQRKSAQNIPRRGGRSSSLFYAIELRSSLLLMKQNGRGLNDPQAQAEAQVTATTAAFLWTSEEYFARLEQKVGFSLVANKIYSRSDLGRRDGPH